MEDKNQPLQRENPSKNESSKLHIGLLKAHVEGVNFPKVSEYVCDATAAHTIAATHDDSAQWLWALDLFRDQVIYIFSSPDSQLFDPEFGGLPWKMWESDSTSNLATGDEVDTFLKLTRTRCEDYFSVSLSVFALLELHSANEPPGVSRCLVSNNREFWELFFSSEDQKEKTRLALMKLRGGKRLVEVFGLWELDPPEPEEKSESEDERDSEDESESEQSQ